MVSNCRENGCIWKCFKHLLNRLLNNIYIVFFRLIPYVMWWQIACPYYIIYILKLNYFTKSFPLVWEFSYRMFFCNVLQHWIDQNFRRITFFVRTPSRIIVYKRSSYFLKLSLNITFQPELRALWLMGCYNLYSKVVLRSSRDSLRHSQDRNGCRIFGVL